MLGELKLASFICGKALQGMAGLFKELVRCRTAVPPQILTDADSAALADTVLHGSVGYNNCSGPAFADFGYIVYSNRF